MNEDVFVLMQDRMPAFSKGQRRIATYIVENYDKTAFMTANALGKAVGISESTVVRFATELGFDGYPGFQKAMQEAVMNRLTSAERPEPSNKEFENDVLFSVLRSDAEKLYQTAEIIDHKGFLTAVKIISEAKRIFVIGSSWEAGLVNFFGHSLSFLFPDVHVAISSGERELFEQVLHAQAGDVAIVFAFSQYSAGFEKIIQFCQDEGVAIVAITNSRLSPIGKLSDVTLVAKSDSVSFVDSLVAPLSVANALLIALSSEKETELQKNLDKFEQIRKEYHVNEKQVSKR